MPPPLHDPPPPPAPLDARALQLSFAQFLERSPENRALAEQAYAEEARAAAHAAEREADARLRAAVRGLAPRERGAVDAALRRAPASRALNEVLLSLCNSSSGGGGSADDLATPEGDSARLQSWLENPRVMELVRRAAKQQQQQQRQQQQQQQPAPPLLDRLFSAAVETDQPAAAAAARAPLPTHALADALNEHARRMALGRAAFNDKKNEEEVLAHFFAAAAAVASVRPEEEEGEDGGITVARRELALASAASEAARADVHMAAGSWAAARAACSSGLAALELGVGCRRRQDGDDADVSSARVSLLARRGRAHLENRDLTAARADLERARGEFAAGGAGRGPGAREAWERGALRPLAAAIRAAERGQEEEEEEEEGGGGGDSKQQQRALYARMLRGL